LLAIVAFTMIALTFAMCKQVYEPPAQATNVRLLVVEGFINGGQGPTTILLSRTGDLQDQGVRPEYGAQVKVEGDDGSAFLFVDSLNGKYRYPQLLLNNNVKYRLHVTTSNGKEYASEYTPVRHTPTIDSVTWQTEDNGVRLYVNTHDPQNLTRYYQWKYDETWEIHSVYYSSLKYLRDASNRITALLWRDPFHHVDTTIYKCWSSLSSTSIILGSSEKLSTDRIYLPVHFIDPGSEKLSVLYSLNLKQYALSQDAYLFMQKIKKNTEQVGTLFDPQPSQISGNFKCLTDPNESVIGFVEVTEEQTKRIFIYNNQVPGWGYGTACIQAVINNNLDAMNKDGGDLYPTVPLTLGPFGEVVTFYAANMQSCMDCTTRGVNRKPAFWP
ncbi:MAG: DUF4249 domain-containing protein, partial [Bacteroidetes bacterium]